MQDIKRETIGALYKSAEISEKKLLVDVLDNFQDSFDKTKAQNFNGSFLFLIQCDNTITEFTIQINKQNFNILYDYRDANPYLRIECSFETFCNITLGKFNPILDILNGKIKLEKGLFSLPRFARFGSLFSYRKINLNLPTEVTHPGKWVKPEKILLVNGSPRRNASTKLMLDWFKEGLPETSYEILDISSLKIGKCLHCFKCWTDHPNTCVIDDDAKVFRQKIDDADLIVFFVPLSYGTMPSDMKRALERLFPETTPFFYHNNKTNLTAHPIQRNKKPQAFLQVLVWGFPEMQHGRMLEENLNEWANHSLKNNLGSLKRPGINMILGDPRMQFVRKRIKQSLSNISKSVYELGIVPKQDKKNVEKVDYCSIVDFQFYATKYWIKRFKTDFWN